MKIKINDKFRVTTDKDNFILEQSRVAGEKAKNTGEFVWKQEGFYTTFDSALRGLLRRELLDCDAETVEELRAVVQDVQEHIDVIKRALEIKEVSDES